MNEFVAYHRGYRIVGAEVVERWYVLIYRDGVSVNSASGRSKDEAVDAAKRSIDEMLAQNQEL